MKSITVKGDGDNAPQEALNNAGTDHTNNMYAEKLVVHVHSVILKRVRLPPTFHDWCQTVVLAVISSIEGPLHVPKRTLLKLAHEFTVS